MKNLSLTVSTCSPSLLLSSSFILLYSSRNSKYHSVNHQQTCLINKNTNVKNHLLKFRDLLIKDKLYWVLIFGFLSIINPYSDLDYAEMFKVKKGYSPDVKWEGWDYWVLSLRGIVIVCCLAMGIRKNQRFIKNTERAIQCFILVQLVVTIFVYSMWYLDYKESWLILFVVLLSDLYTNLRAVLVSVICVQYVSRNVERGYESFSINSITSIVNISVLFSDTCAIAVVDAYLKNKGYNDNSFNLVSAMSLLYTTVLFIFSVYIIDIREASKIQNESEE